MYCCWKHLKKKEKQRLLNLSFCCWLKEHELVEESESAPHLHSFIFLCWALVAKNRSAWWTHILVSSLVICWDEAVESWWTVSPLRMTGDICLYDWNLSNTELISNTTVLWPLPSTVSHSSFLWTTPPTARQTQRHTEKETDSKERRGGRETRKEESRKGGQREADKTKKLRTRQTGALKALRPADREGNVQHVVNMLTHGRTRGSFNKNNKWYLGSLNLQPCGSQSM